MFFFPLDFRAIVYVSALWYVLGQSALIVLGLLGVSTIDVDFIQSMTLFAFPIISAIELGSLVGMARRPVDGQAFDYADRLLKEYSRAAKLFTGLGAFCFTVGGVANSGFVVVVIQLILVHLYQAVISLILLAFSNAKVRKAQQRERLDQLAGRDEEGDG